MAVVPKGEEGPEHGPPSSVSIFQGSSIPSYGQGSEEDHGGLPSGRSQGQGSGCRGEGQGHATQEHRCRSLSLSLSRSLSLSHIYTLSFSLFLSPPRNSRASLQVSLSLARPLPLFFFFLSLSPLLSLARSLAVTPTDPPTRPHLPTPPPPPPAPVPPARCRRSCRVSLVYAGLLSNSSATQRGLVTVTGIQAKLTSTVDLWAKEGWRNSADFTSLTAFLRSFFQSQFPHKFVNLIG